MKLSIVSAAAIAGSLCLYAPAFAQAPASSHPATAAQKQHTDGGDSPANPGNKPGTAAEWHKQHTDGGDSPANPGAFQK